MTPRDVLRTIDGAAARAATTLIANHNAHSLFLLRRSAAVAGLLRRRRPVQIDSTPLIAWGRLMGLPLKPRDALDLPRLARQTSGSWPRRGAGGCSIWAARRAWLTKPPRRLGRAPPTRADRRPPRLLRPRAATRRRTARCWPRSPRFDPDVLMVGMGMPLQEIWALENRSASGARRDPHGRRRVRLRGRRADAPRRAGPVGWGSSGWRGSSTSRGRLAYRYLVEPWCAAGPGAGRRRRRARPARRRAAARRWPSTPPADANARPAPYWAREACNSMPVYFEGFPRVVERAALKPGRWFVAAEGARPLICFSTEEGGEGDERLVLTFGTTRPEALDFAPAPLKSLIGPLATLEHELVFAPGLAGHSPQLTAPVRRPFRPGALLAACAAATSASASPAPAATWWRSRFATGLRVDGYDLVFDRWTLSLRRGGGEAAGRRVPAALAAHVPAQGMVDDDRPAVRQCTDGMAAYSAARSRRHPAAPRKRRRRWSPPARPRSTFQTSSCS